MCGNGWPPRCCLRLARTSLLPCVRAFAAKLLAELPVSCMFPLVFGGVVYPFTGLNPKPSRCCKRWPSSNITR